MQPMDPFGDLCARHQGAMRERAALLCLAVMHEHGDRYGVRSAKCEVGRWSEVRMRGGCKRRDGWVGVEEKKEGKEGKEGRRKEGKKKRTNKTEKSRKKTPNPQSTSVGRSFDGYECNRIPLAPRCLFPCCSVQVVVGGWMHRWTRINARSDKNDTDRPYSP